MLDVGCGFGALGRAILDSRACPPRVSVLGLERVKRGGGELIEVQAYDGVTDVLHHEEEPDRLISECARVSRRLLIIKDHKLDGPLARWRVQFMDWAANVPYAVPCLYRYNTPDEWAATRASSRKRDAHDEDLPGAGQPAVWPSVAVLRGSCVWATIPERSEQITTLVGIHVLDD